MDEGNNMMDPTALMDTTNSQNADDTIDQSSTVEGGPDGHSDGKSMKPPSLLDLDIQPVTGEEEGNSEKLNLSSENMLTMFGNMMFGGGPGGDLQLLAYFKEFWGVAGGRDFQAFCMSQGINFGWTEAPYPPPLRPTPFRRGDPPPKGGAGGPGGRGRGGGNRFHPYAGGRDGGRDRNSEFSKKKERDYLDESKVPSLEELAPKLDSLRRELITVLSTPAAKEEPSADVKVEVKEEKTDEEEGEETKEKDDSVAKDGEEKVTAKTEVVEVPREDRLYNLKRDIANNEFFVDLQNYRKSIEGVASTTSKLTYQGVGHSHKRILFALRRVRELKVGIAKHEVAEDNIDTETEAKIGRMRMKIRELEMKVKLYQKENEMGITENDLKAKDPLKRFEASGDWDPLFLEFMRLEYEFDSSHSDLRDQLNMTEEGRNKSAAMNDARSKWYEVECRNVCASDFRLELETRLKTIGVGAEKTEAYVFKYAYQHQSELHSRIEAAQKELQLQKDLAEAEKVNRMNFAAFERYKERMEQSGAGRRPLLTVGKIFALNKQVVDLLVAKVVAEAQFEMDDD